MYEKSPDIEVIADHFEISEQEVVYAMDASAKPISLFTLVGDESGKEQYLIDKVENESELDAVDTHLIYSVIQELPPREKKIIMLRYFRDKTQKEIALELGVSQVQVSRLENKILQKLREQLE